MVEGFLGKMTYVSNKNVDVWNWLKAWTDNQLKLVLILSQDETKILRLTSNILAGMKIVYIMNVFSIALNWYFITFRNKHDYKTV